ncbi:hypothetical protein POM88_038613 [Heracleum sosnowskyi]|uniref:Protein kinase domain-containing protein n=1 Tax=Heracleum sosnowskyi TaxID=360622 RepID=A0AAD8H8A4_9APIA|nr:hypothetical protein POM88_038604 [Heracleum sosnowskyi]KAK1363052.1 hypothetical protein POM88_038613 [Heracleum sosnowskyi]
MELYEGGELLDRILWKSLVQRAMKPEDFLFKSPKEDSPLKATDFGLSETIKPGQHLDNFMYYPAHPWVRKGGDASEIPLDISVLFNMRQLALRLNTFPSFGTCLIDVQIVEYFEISDAYSKKN